MCVSGQTNSSPGCEKGMAFLTLLLGWKVWYYASVQVNTVLNLLEHRGKGSPSSLTGGRNVVSVGSPMGTGWKTQTPVRNVQFLLLSQSSTLCRHPGALFHWSLTIKCTDETINVEDTETHPKYFLSEVLSNKKKWGMYFFWELIAQFAFYRGFWRVHETCICLEVHLICLLFKEELKNNLLK